MPAAFLHEAESPDVAGGDHLIRTKASVPLFSSYEAPAREERVWLRPGTAATPAVRMSLGSESHGAVRATEETKGAAVRGR
ncbi:hypothetical protein VTK73DRAFT_996 [Phialemonium thermophilum]|uniref:Uncharacterized protein n=1 Tax=Phialemonium thermophilum TaxID=223376 RepID=A0ABR3VU33_9PEZI